MPTNLIYLEDTYKFSGQSSIKDVSSDERGQYCILSETVFYPQGGGQPSDTGTIDVGNSHIPISSVKFVDGEVRHYGNFSGVNLNVEDMVLMSVNSDERIRNAKAHTAGHLMYGFVEEMDNDLIAFKGYHFPKGSYVEFKGTPSFVDKEIFIAEINEKMKEAISLDLCIEADIVTPEELTSRWSNIPYQLPEGKPLRVVTISGLHPTPCGGTHLKSLGELKNVEITKIKVRKGNTKISYNFS
ncbi:MAG: alanine--tRNA ligase-related protein [Cyanobacteria bacterium P01_F01_bin.150]